MAKKTDVKKLSEKTRALVSQIPLEQRKRITRSKTYREGWLDSTLFWQRQLDKTFQNGKLNRKYRIATFY